MSIQISGLVKVYGEQKAIEDLSFEAQKGRILGFLGPNGAGKSTTMKIATGYLRPTSGEVFANGIKVTSNPYRAKMITGYLPEHNPLYHEMYVREFLKFVSRAYKMRGSKSKIEEVIARCGLNSESHKKIKMLSKGFRQRVGLAKALLPDPSILILDEPTTGLDPNQIIEIRALIREVSHDKTVILSTHIMQEVEALCDDVVIIDKGKLILSDNLKDIKGRNSTNSRFRVSFDIEVDTSLLRKWDSLSSFEKLDEKSYVFAMTGKEPKKAIIKFSADHDLPLHSVYAEGGSLEEVFQNLTNRKEGPV